MKSTKTGFYITSIQIPAQTQPSVDVDEGEQSSTLEVSHKTIVAQDIEHRHGAETINFLPVFIDSKGDVTHLQEQSIARDEIGIFQIKNGRRRYFKTN